LDLHTRELIRASTAAPWGHAAAADAVVERAKRSGTFRGLAVGRERLPGVEMTKRMAYEPRAPRPPQLAMIGSHGLDVARLSGVLLCEL
jgi:hypothetical protein